jgi:hypothetical protein
VERPASVTVTCWVIIALAIEALIGLFSSFAETMLKELVANLASPLSLSSTIISGAVVAAVTIMLAIFMLRGMNWARFAYLGLSAILFLCMLAFYSRVPLSILFIALAKLLVFGALLLRTPANQYFIPPRSDIAA